MTFRRLSLIIISGTLLAEHDDLEDEVLLHSERIFLIYILSSLLFGQKSSLDSICYFGGFKIVRKEKSI